MTTFSPIMAPAAAQPGTGPAAPPATSPTSPGPDQASPPGAVPLPGPVLEPDLLASDPAGLANLGRLVVELTRAAATGLRRRTGPLPAGTPEQLAARVTADLAGTGVLPRRGLGAGVLPELIRRYVTGTVDLSDPAAAAHLQPPALTVAVAADLIASAFNASVDTWDSGPSAVELERQVIGALTELAGYRPTAGGVLTSGGSASNLQALLIARDLAADRAARAVGGTAPGPAGWPGELRPVVFCSEVAHFSVARASAVLGLGADAVRTVPVDRHWRMRPDALARALAELPTDTVPVAVVATAGNTDFGTVDPIAACAEVTRRAGVRLHVDAAYGGGALFSDRLRPLLAGLSRADSITLDLHKIGWQPAAASVLLLRDAGDFTRYRRRIAYLNPDDDGAAGYDGLLDLSLATTRRADALKVAATFLALGRDGLGDLLDACHELARYAEQRVLAQPRLELAAGATLTTVVFRYRTGAAARSDQVNGALRRRLLRSGTALIGRTTVPGRGVHLKLTLLNPQTRPSDVDELLAAVVRAGRQEENAE